MDEQALWVVKQDDTFKLIDHRPGVPDMTLATADNEEELHKIAIRIVTGIGWEDTPVYVRADFNCWKNINPHS